jgi:hypothetical protein
MFRLASSVLACSLIAPIFGADDDLYNLVGQLRGQVVLVNHPTLGRTPASGYYLLFQREGCKLCLIGVRTDVEGRYELLLGEGKYRIVEQSIQRTGDYIVLDFLPKRQAREVVVHSGSIATVFNIEVEFAKE